jgi:hypothetical protein
MKDDYKLIGRTVYVNQTVLNNTVADLKRVQDLEVFQLQEKVDALTALVANLEERKITEMTIQQKQLFDIYRTEMVNRGKKIIKLEEALEEVDDDITKSKLQYIRNSFVVYK